MYIKNLKMRNVRKLEELILDNGVFNTEALMLLFKENSFPDRVPRVFKYLDMQEMPDVMEKKDFTVTTLNSLDEYLSIQNLLIPDTKVYVDGKLAGFALPFIPNHHNVGKMLHDCSTPFCQKLFYVSQIGDIISKVQNVSSDTFRFQFGDLNEYNFILSQEGKINAIDLDSAYVGWNEPQEMIYYLLRNKIVRSVPEKYPVSKQLNIIPTDDTDLFCYHMILLRVLAKEDFSCLPIEIYNDYLDYIKKLPVPHELIESFESLYTIKKNWNPKDSIMGISENLEEKLDYKTFQKNYYHK